MKIEYDEATKYTISGDDGKIIKQINITFEKDDIFDIILDYIGKNGYLDDISGTKIKIKYRKICVYKNYHKKLLVQNITKQTGTKISIFKPQLINILLKFIIDNKKTYIRNDIPIKPDFSRANIVLDDDNKTIKLYIY